ncbi:verprolin-like [Cornus florida]|uniref:verprolin-like n=1 Tax=Cornus florida TaxID=4283 RepID=UPI0028973A62|nr:verprolin-like [Cornus florida]
MAGGRRQGKSVQDPAELEEMQVSELPVESSRFAPDENDMVEKFAQTMANGPIMDNIRMMAMQQDRFAQDQAKVAQNLARVAQDQSKAVLSQNRKLGDMVDRISQRFESMLERTLGSLNQGLAPRPNNSEGSQQSAFQASRPAIFVEGSSSQQHVGPLPPTQQQVQSLPMAQTYIPAAPVTAPMVQMTIPKAAPMPTIQQVQNPPPVPAAPVPARPPPMVIPMAVGGQPFPREPFLDQGGRNRGRNNYADANPLLMAGGGYQVANQPQGWPDNNPP